MKANLRLKRLKAVSSRLVRDKVYDLWMKDLKNFPIPKVPRPSDQEDKNDVNAEPVR